MALQKGDAACSAGLSKRIYDNLVAGGGGFASTPAGVTGGKAMAYAIACAVVDEITTNAAVSTNDIVPALGLVAPAGGGPVTGAAAGTGTGTIA
ncbi:MAG: hypothetical protein PHU49_15790 [Syntrophorhabdaceae bacterium]|nr:hypothetical protein [Syntrophorhabdaceae bacterium]